MPDLNKIKRHVYIASAIVFLYSIPGISLDPNAKLFNAFIVGLEAQVWLSWVLFIITIYFMSRYWHFSKRLDIAPEVARKNLMDGKLANSNMFTSGKDLEDYHNAVNDDVNKYLPGMPIDDWTITEFVNKNQNWWTIQWHNFHEEKDAFIIPFKTKVSGWYQSLDYNLPLVVCGVALTMFVFKLLK